MMTTALPPPSEIPGVEFSHFQSDEEDVLPRIQALMERDLSEPYSVFTYRYFIQGWPELTIMATSTEKEEGKGKGRLLGVIVCKADRQNRRRRLRGYIAMLAVEKDARGKGIGSNLVHRAVCRMQEKGCDEVVLETELANTSALTLYARMGFVRDKRLSKYYLNGGDAFRLKFWLTSPGVSTEEEIAQAHEAAATTGEESDVVVASPPADAAQTQAEV